MLLLTKDKGAVVSCACDEDVWGEWDKALLENCALLSYYTASHCVLTHKSAKVLTFIIKQKKKCINFSNLFLQRYLRVSDRFSVHHQESSTVYTGTGICHTGYADRMLAGSYGTP